jgi:adenylosuccinate lyase
MGRTHGVHAEPLTFGLKLTTWAFELDRARTRLRAAADDLATGKISGPVGSYSQLPPSIEVNALGRLGLKADEASTQVVQRDRHAAFLAAIAVTGGSLERFAVEIRNLQHTELAEVGEPFKRGQTGSSAMPHKRNPILAERLTGMSRLLRGFALSGLEDQALWHERDISHSSVERVALPGATTLLHYMLERFRRLVEGLVVRPERMAENIERGLGLHCSSRLLTTLVDAGLARTDAYAIVQRNAMLAFDERSSFRSLVEADPDVTSTLTPEVIEHCFDDHAWLTHVREVIARLERLDP